MMNDKDLKRNGSGYVDDPCYKAVTAPPRPGEIWIHGKSGAYMLVLANVNGICPTLRLTDVDGEGTVPVMCKTQMYSKPYMISYCFENLLTEFVKVVKGDEMKKVRKGLIKALGLFDDITQDNPMPDEFKAMQEELDSLKAGYKQVFDENAALKEKLGDATRELALNHKLPYKAMYEDLIGRLIAKGRVD